MMLIMCHCGGHRYAIDSRHVNEVLPRVNLASLSGSPDWLAGMLIHRGNATPVIDLMQLSEGKCCHRHLSSRIVVLQTELRGSTRRFGVLTERVELCEVRAAPDEPSGRVDGPAALGDLRLDEQGIFQLIDIPRLISDDRQAVLFPVAGRGAVPVFADQMPAPASERLAKTGLSPLGGGEREG